MQKRLVSLSAVTVALGLTEADAARAGRIADAASRTVYSVIQRPYLFRHTYSDVYDGSGSERQMLRNWPVLAVESVSICAASVPPAAAYGQVGFRFDPWDSFAPGAPQSLTLTGGRFHRGLSNVAVTYTAGYAVLKEAHTVPTSADYSVIADVPLGSWAVDDGVEYAATGVPLVRVASTPAPGQYTAADGKYTFSSADASHQVLVSYSFTPADIEHAALAVAADLFNSDFTGNIKSLKAGDATVERFSASSVSQDVLALLTPYRSVIGV